MNMKKYCTDISIKKRASECTELPITDRVQHYYLYRNKIQQAMFKSQVDLCDRSTNIPLNINADFSCVGGGGVLKENKIKSISIIGMNIGVYQYTALDGSSRTHRTYGDQNDI